MKAIVHEGTAGLEGVSYREIEEPLPGKGEVRIRLKAAGLNHRDLFVLKRHKENEPPLIIGSDGAGIVESVGEGVTAVKAGDEVIINPGLGWPDQSDAPPEGFEIVGLPFHGTFAKSITVPAENALPKPKHLSWEEAGVLSLAALTAYRALFTRGKVKPGMKVLIPGIGSGVATFLLQFAKAAGAAVYVTSRSKEKRQKALELGANKAIDSSADWNEALNGEKMDLVIESVGAATFNQSLGQLRTGGTIVTFGASAGDDVTINLRTFFYGQFNMLGSTMGSGEELKDMLHFIEEHQIHPVMDRTYSLSEYQEAFTRLERAEQIGKIAFSIE
ncbi:zinc-binding dehydrogenase [Domibacillus enclensis]|uniref:Alcohol dehydrogenase n=1 Tax=Domibacillus enclensis TaxID=1017273 RepID=A0A1N6WMN7_9BACI|nr:zinc-binding dehydrogenase [Domibacillus enclensis]OXS77983.1 alcohol dehydrogenase [Domibacillus enclensis]SIQ91282.1 zinc-binding alcohol dehydrogenase/oxidoreductase [Domibacillus enclensis]